MGGLCLMLETAHMRRLDEFVYSTDSYCYLLKHYNSVFAYLFWMKRTREKIGAPTLPNDKRHQKERLQLIQAKPS